MSFITENRKETPIGKSILLYLFLVIFGLLIGSLAVLAIPLMGHGSISSLKWGQAISSTFLFILPPIVLYLFTRQKPFQQIGFTKPNNITIMFVGIIVMFAALPIISQLTEWNENMKLPASLAKLEEIIKAAEEQAQQMTEQMLAVTTFGGLVANLIVIALIAAVGEELTFRGVIQQFLTKICKNAHIAIILSAAIFSAIHFQFYGFLPRMVLGVFLGYFFYMTKSLWTSILMHFANNALAIIAYYLYHKGIIETDIDNIGATRWYITIMSVIMCAALIIYSWNKSKQEHKNQSSLNIQ